MIGGSRVTAPVVIGALRVKARVITIVYDILIFFFFFFLGGGGGGWGDGGGRK